jgi:hypothetical protein
MKSLADVEKRRLKSSRAAAIIFFTTDGLRVD